MIGTSLFVYNVSYILKPRCFQVCFDILLKGRNRARQSMRLILNAYLSVCCELLVSFEAINKISVAHQGATHTKLTNITYETNRSILFGIADEVPPSGLSLCRLLTWLWHCLIPGNKPPCQVREPFDCTIAWSDLSLKPPFSLCQ